MFDLHTFESLRTAAAVEERNERPLLAALFAVIIGWSIADGANGRIGRDTCA